MQRKIKAVEFDAHWYGLEDLTNGNPDRHWRYATPDGVKHRSQRAAVRHMKQRAVAKLVEAWGAKGS